MMQLWRLIALPVLLGFLILGIYLFVYLGGWKEVSVTKATLPEMQLLYKVHRGAYHKIVTAIESVEQFARSRGIPCPRTFGEYLDNPRQVAEERLTSHAGCVLEKPLAEAPPAPSGTEGDEFKIKTLPAGDYIQAIFTGSPAIGPWRVYPRLTEFADRHGLRTAPSTIEIYTITPANGLSTEYLVPVIPAAIH
jgi:AraC family transcriptional regulator